MIGLFDRPRQIVHKSIASMTYIKDILQRHCGFTPAHQLQQVQQRAFQEYTGDVTSNRNSSKVAPHARRFSSPRCLQQFGRLPTEIRIMIFRDLLLNDKPLDWDSSRSSDGRPNFDFEPNVLAVCQSWYAEAADILYQENTFVVFFKPDNGYPVGFLRMLYAADCARGGFGLAPQFQQFPQGIEKFATKFLLRLWLYPFHIPAKLAREDRAFKLLPVFCRATINLFAGSDITLQLWSRDKNYSIEAFEAVSHWTGALKMLRCKSFQVRSPAADGQISLMGCVWDVEDLALVEETLAGIRRLTAEIISNTKPVDLYVELFSVTRVLIRFQMSLSEPAARNWVDRQIAMLKVMVMEQNHNGFRQFWEHLRKLIDSDGYAAGTGKLRRHKICSFKVRYE